MPLSHPIEGKKPVFYQSWCERTYRETQTKEQPRKPLQASHKMTRSTRVDLLSNIRAPVPHPPGHLDTVILLRVIFVMQYVQYITLSRNLYPATLWWVYYCEPFRPECRYWMVLFFGLDSRPEQPTAPFDFATVQRHSNCPWFEIRSQEFSSGNFLLILSRGIRASGGSDLPPSTARNGLWHDEPSLSKVINEKNTAYRPAYRSVRNETRRGGWSVMRTPQDRKHRVIGRPHRCRSSGNTPLAPCAARWSCLFAFPYPVPIEWAKDPWSLHYTLNRLFPDQSRKRQYELRSTLPYATSSVDKLPW